MNKVSFLLSVFILSLLHSQAQKNTLASLWRDSAIVIDGQPGDWDQPFRFYDSKSKLQYSVVNDAENLYVCIMTSDPKTQMKIARAGMRLLLDTNGKKKESAVVLFPLRGDNKLELMPDPNDADHSIVEHPDIKKMKLNFGGENHAVKTQGLIAVPATMTMEDTTKSGFKIALGWDRNDVMTYEIRIPFRTFYKENLAARDTLKPIGIGVKIEGMVLPMMPNSTNTGADVSGAGGTTPANRMGSSGRPSAGAMQPAMILPQNAAELAESLQIYMRMKLIMK